MKTTEFWNYAKETDYIFAHCTFLEEFYHLTNDQQRIESIQEEPDIDIDPSVIKNDDTFSITEIQASVAAMAHRLAVENNLPVPKWVNKKRYFLPNPVYQFHTENPEYQNYLKMKAFPEYRLRNLFYDDNTLKRA